MKEKKHLLNLLKVVAILLVINSHSGILFPERLRVLATGGALGNGIFFILSGYFSGKKEFKWKNAFIRFCRLYIPVYVIEIFSFFLGADYLVSIHDIRSLFEYFIWPTSYWFVSAAFASYILLEVIKKKATKENSLFFLAAILIIYFVCYIWGLPVKQTFIVEDGYIFNWSIQFKCITGFFLYVTGYFINAFELSVQKNKAVLLALVSFILTYATRLFMQKGLLPMNIQFITQFCVMGFSIGALMIAIQYEDQYRKFNKHFINAADSLSKVSLEAYIIQMRFIPTFAAAVSLIFPINYIASTVIIIVLSYCLYYIDTLLMRIIRSI